MELDSEMAHNRPHEFEQRRVYAEQTQTRQSRARRQAETREAKNAYAKSCSQQAVQNIESQCEPSRRVMPKSAYSSLDKPRHRTYCEENNKVYTKSHIALHQFSKDNLSNCHTDL